MAKLTVKFINGEELEYEVSDDFKENHDNRNGFIQYEDKYGREVLLNAANVLSIEEQ